MFAIISELNTNDLFPGVITTVSLSGFLFIVIVYI